jgi:hypothetical protein
MISPKLEGEYIQLFILLGTIAVSRSHFLFENNSKTASLGEMIQNLQPLGVNVPGGFGVTSAAYDAVLDRFRLRERLHTLLQDLDGKASVCGVFTTELPPIRLELIPDSLLFLCSSGPE